jgi:hypothetical protein
MLLENAWIFSDYFVALSESSPSNIFIPPNLDFVISRMKGKNPFLFGKGPGPGSDDPGPEN